MNQNKRKDKVSYTEMNYENLANFDQNVFRLDL